MLLRRTGGFAGLVRERQVVLGQLPEEDTRSWQQLLAEPVLRDIAAHPASRPDAYCYSVVCREVGLDVRVAEPHLPPGISQLFERTLEER